MADLASPSTADDPRGDAPIAVSAPGKVLLAGGYLVLDRAYTGLVFGLSARIHALVQPEPPSTSGVVVQEITVRSPQFREAVWIYGYRAATQAAGGCLVTQLQGRADRMSNRNPFVETTLTYVLSYITASSRGSTNPFARSPPSITILADNDYYTTPSSSTAASTRFHTFPTPIAETHKTGLGSSAALVTAITAALLTYYLPSTTFSLSPASPQREPSLRTLHNLAQTAHCAAQGKVGSGFDVAAAVYGSHVYRRFSPELLSAQPEPGSAGFAPALATIVDGTAWDVAIGRDAVRVPASLRVVLADVDAGSATPGMVKQVLAWRAREPALAERVWRELDAANGELAAALRAVAEAESSAAAPGEKADRTPLRHAFARIRGLIREMSEHTGVPIEPPAQTELLDACAKVPGVVGGVVPGAGGFDAVALLVEKGDANGRDPAEGLRELFAGWKFAGKEDGKVSLLGVREEMEGVREEDVAGYGEW